MLKAILSFVFVMSFGIIGFAVIYGDDNRTEIVDVKDDAIKELAKSTAILVGSYFLNIDTPRYAHPRFSTLQTDINMCTDERFAQDPILAACSSFLVHEEWLATATHCVTQSLCERTQFVFDFQKSADQKMPTDIPTENIYSCDRVYTPPNAKTNEYALIHLTRPVENRRPLKLANENAQIKDAVFVIGNPLGLATKYADDAQIRSISEGNYIVNTDTFGVNSGSAIFKASTNEVIGMLVGGDEDFEYDPDHHGFCQFVHRCESNGCRGEDVLNISKVKEGLQTVLSR